MLPAPPVLTEPAVATELREQRAPGRVILARTARQATRSGLLWGYLFGIVVASSAVTYIRTYKTPAERERLAAAFGSNRATAALFGPAPHLETVAGFTVFKSIMTLMILGALWGLLTSTRLLRGEEDAGRWDVMLSGLTTREGATVQAVAGMGGGAITLWLITAAFTVGVGQYSLVDIAPQSGLYFATAAVATAVMFLAVGSLTSQLAGTRRQAASYAGWILGSSYALRMVADAGVGLHGLIWASPLGWVEQLQPLTSPEPLALLPAVAFTLVVTGLAISLAGRRDVRASILPDRTHAPARTKLLFGQVGLTIRLLRPNVLAWVVALAATGFILGLVAKGAGATISGSSVNSVFTRLGATGAGERAYLGVSFLILAVLAAFMAGGQISAMRGEESEGRLDRLLAASVSRSSWLGGRALVGSVVLVVGAVLAGVSTWLGTLSQGAEVSFGTLVEASVNVVPPALCLFGIGILVFGLWPRAAAYATYGVLAWSVLVEVVGGVGVINHLLLDTSLFHHMAAAPAVNPNWTKAGVIAAVGLGCGAAGMFSFARRDLQGR